MKARYILPCGKTVLMTAFVALATAVPLSFAAVTPAHAFVCGRGFYRAGCAGPNGAVMVRRPGYGMGYGPYYRRPVYRGPGVTCARGPYRAGCVGPYGAVVRPY